MTTRLEAINTMRSCVGQAPLNSLEGTKSYFTIAAENILDDEVKQIQLQGWDFNSEENFQLSPDVNNFINIPPDITTIKFPYPYKNRYVIRQGKLYDKWHHTFKIPQPVKASVVFCFKFEDLPETVKTYAKMSAAYKFTKRELGSEKTCIYTQEDLAEAKAAMIQYDLQTGNYSLIPEMYNGTIESSL